MRNLKKKIVMLLVVALLSTSILPGFACVAWADTVTWQEALDATDESIETDYNSEDWSNFARARKIDADLTGSGFVEYGEKIENMDFSEKDPAGYTTALLALEAIGRGDSVKSGELTEKLMTYDPSDDFFKNASAQTKANLLQSLQGQVDLNTVTYQKNKTAIDNAIDSLKQDLVSLKATAGDYWISWGNKDIDTSAAVAEALSIYADTESISSGTADWIISEKNTDNGYGYSYSYSYDGESFIININGKKTNVNSTAMAIIALIDNGKDTEADAAVAAMMDHYLGDGSFEYDDDTYGTKEPNAMATEQADYALVAYERSKTAGATSLFDFSDVTAVYYFSFDGNGASNIMKTQAVKSGNTANLNPSTFIKNGYRFIGWRDADGNSYTDYQAVTASKDIRLYAVWVKESSGGGSSFNPNAETEAAVCIDSSTAVAGDWIKNPETGKWTFLVDGQPVKGRWAAAKNSYANNKAAWFLFDNNGDMLTGWQQYTGSDRIARWYYLNPVSNGWLGACYLNTTTPDGYEVDANGAWIEPANDPDVLGDASSVDGIVGDDSTDVKSETNTKAEQETEKEENKITISVSIDGSLGDASGNHSFTADGEVEVKKNASAYDALKAFAKKKGWSVNGSSSYVSGINGLKEKSNGPLSGWIYSVNGETPGKSIGSYKLSDGDSVELEFVESPIF